MKRDQYLQQIRSHLKSAYLLSEEKATEVLPGFLATLAEHLTGLEKAAELGDIPNLGRAGHTVKGALLNLGLPELAEIALAIEQQGKAGTEAANYAALIRQLRTEIDQILS